MTEEDKNKVEALSDALSKTNAIMDTFLSIVKHDYKSEVEKIDFTKTATKILKDQIKEETKVETNNSVTNKLATTEDPRSFMTMLQLEGDCLKCQRCKLSKTRNNVVFGEGVTDRPLVMVIGEGPGETEDITGRPFVGKAGQFLDTWLKAISLSRETNTYIANIVKCRPPQNRDPEIDEKENCFGYLKQQIALIKPQAILCLGKPASIKMTGLEESMSTLHGKCHFYDGIPTICTYHPAAVLRDMSLKRPVWEDLQKLARLLNLEYGKRK